ncbi:MAG: uroporphyrinogen decarboxylase [Chloroflexi bacterium]|nr:uroporphyrinogen decarboxylase [Chloroflexota bacterium]
MSGGVPGEPSERFLRACRRLPVDQTPVWFMRQAGRYMAEYRELRQKYSLLEICRQPELAAQVTLQPIEHLGVDAAILFADILLPLIPMGAELEFVAGRGPVIANPVRSKADINKLRPVDVRTQLDYVMEALRIVRPALPGGVALIGFAGAPFTVGSYLIEGGPSRKFERTKSLMYADPQSWHALMERLAEIVSDYLVAQIEAGAQAVQIFDSWVGALSPADYVEYVQPYSEVIFKRIRQTGAPAIHFGTGTSTLLPLMFEAGGEVIGVDWRIPLDRAWELLGAEAGLQGNLDPTALLGPRTVLKRQVERVLREAGGRPGHIFNLGHGVLPSTPIENVKWVVELVQSSTAPGQRLGAQ